MTEKAYRSAGIELSKPIRLGDMERAPEFPLQMFGLRFASKYALDRPLTFDQLSFSREMRTTGSGRLDN